MGRILLSSDVRGALRQRRLGCARQQGFLLNPFRFAGAAGPGTDRTSQPPDGVSLSSRYTGGVFLWNAIAPTKNQLNSATVTLSGTTTAGGADGQYHTFTPAGAMDWTGIAKPATAYTLVWLIAMPSALGTFVKALEIPNGNFRVEVQRTGGGVYISHVHTSSAAPTAQYIEGVGSPDTEMITYIAAYSSGTLRRYLKLGDGTNASNLSEALSYNNGGDSTLRLGNPDGSVTFGGYAVAILNNDVGDTECIALRNNGWRIFQGT
jgi:hypothetical protein